MLHMEPLALSLVMLLQQCQRRAQSCGRLLPRREPVAVAWFEYVQALQTDQVSQPRRRCCHRCHRHRQGQAARASPLVLHQKRRQRHAPRCALVTFHRVAELRAHAASPWTHSNQRSPAVQGASLVPSHACAWSAAASVGPAAPRCSPVTRVANCGLREPRRRLLTRAGPRLRDCWPTNCWMWAQKARLE